MAVTANQVAFECAGRFANTPANLKKYAAAFTTWLGAATASVANVTNKALTSNVVTLTLGVNPYASGASVVVAGVGAPFDGTFTLTASSGLTVSYAVTNADIASVAASGTASGSNAASAEQTYAALRAASNQPHARYGTPAVVVNRAAKVLEYVVNAGA